MATGQVDPRAAFYAFAPGLLLTRSLEDAVLAQFAANGGAALTQGQVLAITGPPPIAPAGLPRFADSNPDPVDGWALDRVAGYAP